jgi:hexosaminidase
MKINNRAVWILFLLPVAAPVRAEHSAIAGVNIVPRPVAVKLLAGNFVLDGQTQILADDPESRKTAGLLNDFLLKQNGLHLRITANRPKRENYISFSRVGSRGLPEDGYRLVIGANSIRVIGQPAGLFYGMQTLTQLLPSGLQPAIELPDLDITDHPRFGYRGVLLDVGRHFFSVTYLKKLLDLAAQYKINRFHWHLTDDEGWRIEIKKYPRLTGDHTPDGEYYTQEQVKDIVAYAQARFITVVPEIEMPGHSQAAVTAYPQLACMRGAHANVLCPKEETFTFLQNVLSEVAALFPGRYVHIGGDEVQKEGWRHSAEAQAIMKREGLKDEDQLQSYFVRRIERFLAAKGKLTIGWDEILEGGLAPNAIVMSWRGEAGGIEAARLKHKVIMSPSDYCYFDYNQGDPKREPASIGGFIPLEKAYGYDPIPKEMKGNERQYILGAQANVWTEYIATPEYLEYMLFPRLLAFSEAVWSPIEGKDYGDFRRRLAYQFDRLDKQDVHFRIPEPEGLKDFYTTTDDHAVVELRSLVPAARIYYTLDGSQPTDGSTRYQSPLQIPLQPDHKSILNLVVVAPGGRRSVVYGATFLRRSYRDAIRVDSNRPGLTFALYDGKFTSAQNIEQGTPAATGIASSFDLQQFGRAVNYGISFDGYLTVRSDDFYRFVVESDDGSVLEVDDEVVVDNDGNHPSRVVTGHIPLRQGVHKLKLKYFQAEGGAVLRVSWAGSGGELQPLVGSALFH